MLYKCRLFTNTWKYFPKNITAIRAAWELAAFQNKISSLQNGK